MDKIFICGSIEPGRDGVGDYTRRLSAELIRQKHRTGIIAYYDSFVEDILITEQQENGISIPVLRLGKKVGFNERMKAAKEFIDHWDPQWLSLQFVPYSFHKKGLPWKLGNELVKLGNGRNWHVMFHELWIDGSDVKTKLIAFLQKCIIKYLIKELQPLVIHTHLPIYIKRLRMISLNPKKLPIFSNFSRASGNRAKDGSIKIAFFSQFTLRPEVSYFLGKLTREIFMEGLDVKILIVGGEESKRTQLKKELMKIPGLYSKISQTGYLDPRNLPVLLSGCDLAVTPVPRHVLGKSGSVAAFLSMGIPVAAPYSKPGFENEKIGFFKRKICEAVLTEPDLEKFQKSTQAAKAVVQNFNIMVIAEKFDSDLDNKLRMELKVSHSFS